MNAALAPLDMQRQILEQRLAQTRADAFTATVNGEASRAAAAAVGPEHGKSLLEEARQQDLRAKAHAAAANRFAELLAALPVAPAAEE